jgi:GMP synthase PP-ATPase subunit
VADDDDFFTPVVLAKDSRYVPRRSAEQLFGDLVKAVGTAKKIADELSHLRPGPGYGLLMETLDLADRRINTWRDRD